MIYMDNAATTKISEAVAKEILNTVEVFGNPSSLHRLGIEAEKKVEAAREQIAKKLGVNKKTIYFTSGGTESNNLALIGTANLLQKRGKHIITSKIEHPSVLETAKFLEKQGFEVSFASVDCDGRLDLEEFSSLLRPDTVLVSIMHANNETGVIQPVEQIKRKMKEKSPIAKLHIDAVQSFCKLPVTPTAWDADLVSVSAHKIHGPKGVGALYIKDGKISPIIHGGEQQSEIRPGTENVLGIAGFGKATETAEFDFSRAKALREYFKERLLKEVENIKINGSDEYSSGSVLNVSFLGVKAEILLHAFEAKGLYVSTGSACSSHKPQPSHVLMAMRLSKKEIEGAVRFSFDETLTEEEIEQAVEIVKTETAEIRKYM